MRRNSEPHTCLGRWNRLFCRNMFLAWLQVPSMMITLCFTVPTSLCCTNSSRFCDLGPGYRINVLLSRHTAASSGCLMEDRKIKESLKLVLKYSCSYKGIQLTYLHWISFQLWCCIFLVANKRQVEELCEVLCSPERTTEVRISSSGASSKHNKGSVWL